MKSKYELFGAMGTDPQYYQEFFEASSDEEAKRKAKEIVVQPTELYRHNEDGTTSANLL
jgi:hypothetical protein